MQIFLANFVELRVVGDGPWGRVAAADGVDGRHAAVDRHPVLVCPSW